MHVSASCRSLLHWNQEPPVWTQASQPLLCPGGRLPGELENISRHNFSALGVLNVYALYKSTHSLTMTEVATTVPRPQPQSSKDWTSDTTTEVWLPGSVMQGYVVTRTATKDLARNSGPWWNASVRPELIPRRLWLASSEWPATRRICQLSVARFLYSPILQSDRRSCWHSHQWQCWKIGRWREYYLQPPLFQLPLRLHYLGKWKSSN